MSYELTQQEINLKNKLILIRDKDWEFDKDTNYYEFILELLQNLGSLDSQLRDELVLNAILKIIYDEKLTQAQYKEILALLSSEKHLFDGIGKENDDSVFNRTFTLLVIEAILKLNLDVDYKFLSDEDILRVYADVKYYFKAEKDVRGYDKEKGWAHSTAHCADLLGTLACYSCLKEKELLQILDLIKEKVCINYYTYINNEDERLINTIINIYDRSCVHSDDIINWIYSFGQLEDKQETFYDITLKQNKKTFLRSLYFRFKELELPIEFLLSVESVLIDLPNN